MIIGRVSRNAPKVPDGDIVAAAEKTVGVRFNDKALLKAALTHPSFANENPTGLVSNQRLEFLGDRVIDLAITEFLYTEIADMTEGELSVLRSKAVNGKTLAAVARKIGLGAHLLLGKGEEKIGRSRESTLEDAFEAVAGAVFIDKGFRPACRFVLKHLRPCIEEAIASEVPLRDPKALLQEHTQSVDGSLPRYKTELVPSSGAVPVFESKVTVGGSVAGTGTGHRKTEAEQQAAQQALANL